MRSLLTKRCFVRDYGEEDREAFVALNTDRKARQHIGGPLSPVEARRLFDRSLHDADPRHGLRWAVFERKSNEYLGHVYLIPWDHQFEMELGIVLRPDYWNTKVGEEVCLATLDHLFAEKQTQKVISTVDVNHAPSIKLLESLGMERTERCQDDGGHYYVYELSRKRFTGALPQQASMAS